MGATPMVPISPAHTTTASASASAGALKPAASPVSAQVSDSSGFSSEPVIPAALLQKWDDVEAIQAQVSNRLSVEEDQMNELSLQGQQMKTRDMIALAVNSHVTTLLDLDGDRDRWTPAYVKQIQQAVYDHIYRLGRFQELIDIPEVENIHIAGCDRVFLKFADGRTERADPVAATDAELMQMIQGIARIRGMRRGPFPPHTLIWTWIC